MSSRSKHYTTTVRPLILAFSSTRFLHSLLIFRSWSAKPATGEPMHRP